MTERAARPARPISALGLIIVPGICCLAPSAFAETRAGVDLATSAKVGTNPDLAAGTETSVAGSVIVTPWLRMDDELSHVGLLGNIQLEKYTHRSDGNLSAWANLDAQKRLSPYVTIGGNLAYRRTNRILDDLLSRGVGSTTDIGGGTDVVLPTAPVPDVSFGGLQTRSESYEGNLNLSVLASTRGQLSLGLGARASRYDSPDVSGLNMYSAFAGYSHSLSERTSLNASVSYARYDYPGSRIGDGSTVSPLVGVSQKLGPTLTVTANVGVSISRSRRPDNSIRSFTLFSGEFELCKDAERSKYCLNAGRSAESTALGGASASNHVKFSLARSVGERNSLSADVNYIRYDSPTQDVAGRVSELIGVSASYSHHFRGRLSAFVTPSFVRLRSSDGPRTNFQVELGLRYRFGARS